MDAGTSRRRRGIGFVTPNACVECRKRKAKCDGETPCGRCVSQNVTECSYDVPVRQSKEEMRSEIQRLREDQKRTNRILDALSSDNSVDILDRLRNGESLESISRTMENFASPSASNYSVHDRLQDMAGSTPCFTVPSTACHSPPVFGDWHK